MKINYQVIKKNIPFIISSLVIIVIISIFLIDLDDQEINNLSIKELSTKGDNNIHKLVVNEVMSSNNGTLKDSKGNLYDWIELYNGNNFSINLANYGLSDDKDKIKWLFPEVTIKAKEYLIIYLSGTTENGLYANFKLKSTGENLVLKKPNGKIIDAISIPALENSESLARDLNGNWLVNKTPTPGYVNTLEGYQNYLNSITTITKGFLKINEVLPRNKGNFMNEDHTFPGYIEIINESKDIINLKGYTLSDNYNSPYKWSFPDISLASGEVIVAYTGNAINNTNNLYTNFKLADNNGLAILSNPTGSIIDKVEYQNLASGLALSRENNLMVETSTLSPGYPNTTKGVNDFSKKKLSNPKTLLINEVMNNNTKYLPQNGASYYDWIELKNNSETDIKLSDYYLTTSSNNLKMYQLPDVTLKKGEYFIIMASGDSNLSNNTYYHAPFKLSDVESLYLVNNNQFIDSILMANVPINYSIGRSNSEGFYYYVNPTPQASNNNGTRQVSMTPIIDKNAGIYNDDQGITVNIKGNGTIYYTLDGTTPSRASNVYTGSLFFNKTTVLKTIIYEENKLPSPIITSSYMINEKDTLPTLSVSLNPSAFKNISSNAWNTDLEEPAYAELFENGKGFTIPCGFKLFGGSTRGLPKKSFQLKFRKEYGASKLNYQVFSNRDFSSFNSLVLRSGSQDYEYAFIRDILGTSLADEIEGIEVQAYKSVNLYINGNYWGIYNIREKIEAEFIANHYNVPAETANIVRIDNNVTAGTNTWYRNIINYVSNNDMTNSQNYEYIKEKIDIESYVDFWIAESYVTNNDIINARFFSHPDVASGKMRTIFYDLDWAWYNYTRDYFSFSTSSTPMSRLQVSTTLLRNLMKNKEFRKTYVERLSYQMNNIWTTSKVLARIDEITNSLKSDMPKNQQRWNLTMATWEDSINEIKEYVNKRRVNMLSQAQKYFNLSKEEMKQYFNE